MRVTLEQRAIWFAEKISILQHPAFWIVVASQRRGLCFCTCEHGIQGWLTAGTGQPRQREASWRYPAAANHLFVIRTVRLREFHRALVTAGKCHNVTLLLNLFSQYKRAKLNWSVLWQSLWGMKSASSPSHRTCTRFQTGMIGVSNR